MRFNFFYFIFHCIIILLYLIYSFFSLSSTETRNSSSTSKKRRPFNKQIIFDSTKFKLKYVLGSGSFGVVTYAEYLDENSENNINGFYALKSISKADVVDTGQISLLCSLSYISPPPTPPQLSSIFPSLPAIDHQSCKIFLLHFLHTNCLPIFLI